jgi:putative membrane protein
MKTLALVTTTLSIGSLLFGCAAIERAMPRTLSDANLMSVLLTIDVHEIAEAKLAIEKASSDPVHAYATQLVDAHSIMLVKHLHVANRIKPDKPNLASALEHTHQNTMEALRTTSGEDFDRAFLAHQVTMHQQSLKLLDEMADSADDFSLHVYLEQARPELLIHLTEAQYLQRQLVAQQ